MKTYRPGNVCCTTPTNMPKGRRRSAGLQAPTNGAGGKAENKKEQHEVNKYWN
jgi:hypothetical protein